MGAERERVAGFGRLENGLRQAGDWYRWGPYVSERLWGTVREDYSPDGDAWNYLTHDQARSHAYRWGEEGRFVQELISACVYLIREDARIAAG